MIGCLNIQSPLRTGTTRRLKREWQRLFVRNEPSRLEWKSKANLSSTRTHRIDLNCATDSMGALLHTHEPESRSSRRAFALEIEADAIILHSQQQNVFVFCKLHLDLFRLSVTSDVGQCCLSDPEPRRFAFA